MKATYEYECSACGYKIQARLDIEDRDKYDGTPCVSCHNGDFIRCVSSPAIEFKGTGWDRSRRN